MTVAKITEITSQSPKGFEEAIRQGLARASKTIHNIQNAWVKEQEVVVDGKGNVTNYRVNLKITFVLD
jgi:flavin-binding protein dodecin